MSVGGLGTHIEGNGGRDAIAMGALALLGVHPTL